MNEHLGCRHCNASLDPSEHCERWRTKNRVTTPTSERENDDAQEELKNKAKEAAYD